jgi:hypothetical protein
METFLKDRPNDQFPKNVPVDKEVLARRAEAERSVREAQAGEAAQASDELGNKAKSVGQDEEAPKDPKATPNPKTAPTPKMIEPEPGMPARPPRVEKPRSESDRDFFKPPPGLKRDERDKAPPKEEPKKRGKNG